MARAVRFDSRGATMNVMHLPRSAAHLASFASKWTVGAGEVPEALEVLVAARCNSRCRMCNVWRLPTRRPNLAAEEMSLRTLQRIAREAHELGTRFVQLSGGEPLLRNDIADIVRAFKSQDLPVYIFSNGTRLTKPGLAEALVEAQPDYMVTSLDSTTASFHDEMRGVDGCWSRTTEGLKHLASEKKRQGSDLPHVKLMSLVSHRNVPEIFGMRELANELGAEEVIFNPLMNKVPSNDLGQEVLDAEDVAIAESHGVTVGPAGDVTFYSENLCFAPFRQMSIDPFGEVYPCCFAQGFLNMDDDLETTFWGEPDYFGMGNVNSASLRDIWTGDRLRRFRKSLHSLPQYGMCEQCNQPAAQPWTRVQPVFRGIAAAERLVAGEVPAYTPDLA